MMPTEPEPMTWTSAANSAERGEAGPGQDHAVRIRVPVAAAGGRAPRAEGALALAEGPFRRLALAGAQRAELVAAEEAGEVRVAEPRRAAERGAQVAHGEPERAGDERRLLDPVDRGGGEEQRVRADPPLRLAVAGAAVAQALLARPHRAQVEEAGLLLVAAAGAPAVPARHVAVEHVPAVLDDEAADRLEGGPAVELDHADRGLVAAELGDEGAGAGRGTRACR